METCVINYEPDLTCTICAKSCKMSELCAKGEPAESVLIAKQMQNNHQILLLNNCKFTPADPKTIFT